MCSAVSTDPTFIVDAARTDLIKMVIKRAVTSKYTWDGPQFRSSWQHKWLYFYSQRNDEPLTLSETRCFKPVKGDFLLFSDKQPLPWIEGQKAHKMVLGQERGKPNQPLRASLLLHCQKFHVHLVPTLESPHSDVPDEAKIWSSKLHALLTVFFGTNGKTGHRVSKQGPSPLAYPFEVVSFWELSARWSDNRSLTVFRLI